METNIEIEYIVKMVIFVLLAAFAIYFVYIESLNLEEEVIEHERACKEELKH